MSYWPFVTIKTRYISRYYCVSWDLIRYKNHSKLVEGSWFITRSKFFTLCFIWLVGWYFLEKSQNKKNIKFFQLIFNVITAPKTLKISRNFQGLEQIGGVLFTLCFGSSERFAYDSRLSPKLMKSLKTPKLRSKN